jgi:ribosomal protein S12 methylthiotransferase
VTFLNFKKCVRPYPSTPLPPLSRSRHEKSLAGGKVFLISLGCAKNRVDSEHMLGLLRRGGYKVVQNLCEADLAVINTCGFVQEAVEEAIGAILEVSEEKRKGRLKALYVAGCLVQRYGYKLADELPEVDGWVGTGEIGRIEEVIARSPAFLMGAPGFLGDHETPRMGTAPFYSTYLKIAEGCDHRCTYCTIPKIRGPFRSRPIRSIVCEAEEMVGRGVVEINLVAQDTTMYGSDLGKGNRLEDLLDALLRINELGWIRILYGHPARISEGLLDFLEKEDRICPYLDIPLQHVHPRVLDDMGRANARETPWRLLERIRRRKRKIAIRTTMIVGFPGETEEAFRELLGFVQWASFDHLGVFVFSPEEGTPAARFGRKVDRMVAEHRRDRLMRVQSRISARKNRALVGSTLPVLVEGVSEETDLLITGRTNMMAPEVDGQVFIRKGIGAAGRISQVSIRKSHVYDLVGEIAS